MSLLPRRWISGEIKVVVGQIEEKEWRRVRKRGEKEGGGEKNVEMDSILQKGILVSLSTQI